jgi:hypothetical protein
MIGKRVRRVFATNRTNQSSIGTEKPSSIFYKRLKGKSPRENELRRGRNLAKFRVGNAENGN